MIHSLRNDGLIENIREINAAIGKVRTMHRSGKPAPKTAARYLEALRTAHLIAEASNADHSLSPIPFRQMVGLTAEQKKTAEWKGITAYLN
jgi:uncharacterized protein YjhX (UPF0386 family)